MLRFLSVMALAFVLTTGPLSGAALAAGEDKGPPPEFEYYQISPLIVPIITDRGLTHQISLVVSLELPYGKKDEFENYKPRLVDAYIRDLYGALGAGMVLTRNNMIDIEALKSRLTTVTTNIVGPDKVHEVLLQAVQQYPVRS